jgi:hypothetical protein
MKINWKKPDASELNAYQKGYIDLAPEGDLIVTLENNLEKTLRLIEPLSSKKLKYRYAENKWSIPEIIVHMIDAERVFSYRMLCIARGDKSAFPGYEQDDYVAASAADERDFKNIIEEYVAVRKATLCLLKSFNNEMLNETGTANNTKISVKAISYMLAGHEIHHIKVINEKYLK